MLHIKANLNKLFYIIIWIFCSSILYAEDFGNITVQNSKGLYRLDKNWFFKPEDKQKYSQEYFSIQDWDRIPINIPWVENPKYSEYLGTAWFRFYIDLQTDSINNYGLFIPASARGMQVFVNGQLLGETREFYPDGTSPPHSTKPRSFFIPNNWLKSGSNSIAIRTSVNNFNASVRADFIYFGHYQEIENLSTRFLVFYSAISFVSLFLFIYFLIYFIYRKQEKAFLHFSILNLCLAIWIFTFKGYALYLIDEEAVFSIGCYASAAILLIALQNFVFTFLFYKKSKISYLFDVFYTLIAISVTIEYLIRKNIFYTEKYIYPIFILSMLPFLFYLLYIAVKAIREQKKYSWHIFFGMIVFTFGLVYSIPIFMSIIVGYPLVNESFFAMSLVFATVLARRYASTFTNLETTQAELRISYDKLGETNRELEELNQTLEDKVIERTTQLEDAHKQIIKLEKQSLEKQLAGGFAHEIRNALAGAKLVLGKIIHDEDDNICVQNSSLLIDIYKKIKNKLDNENLAQIALLVKQINDNEQNIERVLKMTREATDRGLKITNQIMEYTRIGETQKGNELIDMEKVIQAIVKENKDEFAKQQINLEIDSERVEVLGFENHLHSIVNNLIMNAKDAVMDIEGEKHIKIRCKREEDMFHLEVVDNGTGIEKENMVKIFEPFFSTKPATGIGLGLGYITKLISTYGGTINVESELGKGTKFMVKMPCS